MMFLGREDHDKSLFWGTSSTISIEGGEGYDDDWVVFFFDFCERTFEVLLIFVSFLIFFFMTMGNEDWFLLLWWCVEERFTTWGTGVSLLLLIDREKNLLLLKEAFALLLKFEIFEIFELFKLFLFVFLDFLKIFEFGFGFDVWFEWGEWGEEDEWEE